MGSAQSAFDNNFGGPVIPEGYVQPSFPSLYLPTFIRGREQGGIYLYDAQAIWEFTLFWTFIVIGTTYGLASLLAVFTLSRSMLVYRHPSSPPSTSVPSTPSIPFSDAQHQSPFTPHSTSPLISKRSRTRKKRPPFWPLVFIPLGALFIAGVTALFSGTVIGFALAAVYSAGGFSMSTWIPFAWAIIQGLAIIVASYSTLTKIL